MFGVDFDAFVLFMHFIQTCVEGKKRRKKAASCFCCVFIAICLFCSLFFVHLTIFNDVNDFKVLNLIFHQH